MICGSNQHLRERCPSSYYNRQTNNNMISNENDITLPNQEKINKSEKFEYYVKEKRKLPLFDISIKNKTIRALVDSGSSVNLINKELVEKVKVREGNKGTITKKLYRPTNEEIGTIKEVKERIQTKTDTGTYEIRFRTMAELEHEAILGYKFLKETNAMINWKEKEKEKTNTVITRNLPEAAKEFAEIFENNKKINFLPPHIHFDLTIEMILNKQIPFKSIYPLSQNEQEA
jgi:gag-polyprotein putative aspartyl protease